MRSVVAGFLALLSCASTGPTMTPSPDRPPNSSAAAAMAPSQPSQQLSMVTVPPPQTSTQNQRANVQVLLQSSSATPSGEQLLAQGPGVYGALSTIFHDKSVDPDTRARALASMANLNDTRGFAELDAVLANPSAQRPQPYFARTAIQALTRAQGARAISTIALAFTWHDATVRSAAAEALGQIGGPAARQPLQQQLDQESNPEVRGALERALAKAKP